jgi:hypothetical protein
MNLIVYGFQGVTRAAAITSGVVAERRPGMHTSQKIESTCSDVLLDRFEITVVGRMNEKLLDMAK